MFSSIGSIIQSAETWADIDKGEYVIVGSPATVTERLLERIAEIGAGNLYAITQFGSMPNDMVRRNLELLSDEVLPRLRKEFPAGAPWPKGE
jgi:alkanesulfonate monooxygenase SsuD/methylene tetrahydromethanopterin reductase-like flavin-dependent oxidoreductase (luciferase family)